MSAMSGDHTMTLTSVNSVAAWNNKKFQLMLTRRPKTYSMPMLI